MFYSSILILFFAHLIEIQFTFNLCFFLNYVLRLTGSIFKEIMLIRKVTILRAIIEIIFSNFFFFFFFRVAHYEPLNASTIFTVFDINSEEEENAKKVKKTKTFISQNSKRTGTL